MADITSSPTTPSDNNLVSLAMSMGRNDARLTALEAARQSDATTYTAQCAQTDTRLTALEASADVTRRALQLLASAQGKKLSVKPDANGDDALVLEDVPGAVKGGANKGDTDKSGADKGGAAANGADKGPPGRTGQFDQYARPLGAPRRNRGYL